VWSFWLKKQVFKRQCKQKKRHTNPWVIRFVTHWARTRECTLGSACEKNKSVGRTIVGTLVDRWDSGGRLHCTPWASKVSRDRKNSLSVPAIKKHAISSFKKGRDETRLTWNCGRDCCKQEPDTRVKNKLKQKNQESYSDAWRKEVIMETSHQLPSAPVLLVNSESRQKRSDSLFTSKTGAGNSFPRGK
jgi:hypothetical protein